MKKYLLTAGISLICSTFASAAPTFSGLKEVLPSVNAAVLRWDRARPGKSGEKVTYRIYTKKNNSWAMDTPLAEVQGDEWVITGLQPGVAHEFLVRASDSTGTDANRKSMTVTPSGKQPTTEWRGVWMTRFEWPKGNKEGVQKILTDAMKGFGDANLNAVIFQVRGQGDTLYPSQDEPWSPLLTQSARTFDPVKFAQAEAKKNGLEFHGWINLSTIWQSGSHTLPKERNHPFYRFGDSRSPEKRLGLIHDSSGKPIQWGSNNYVWLTHGNPEVNAYVRKQVMDFIVNYQPDGMHLDDNTGNPNGVSKDPISVQRFNGRGNPMKIKDLGAWQRDQVTRMISDIYVQGKILKPDLVYTASPFGIADRTRIPGYQNFSDASKFGTNPEEWLEQGIMDALIPQVYWDLPDPMPNYGTLVHDWFSHNDTGGAIWPGSNLGKYGDVQPLLPMQEKYVALVRALGGNGMTFFSLSKATPAVWARDGRKIFPQKAKVPEVQSRYRGTGQVAGYFKNKLGQPITDGWIKLNTSDYIYLSGADGFYGLPHVKAGSYTIQFLGNNNERIDQQITVKDGETTRLDVRLP